MKQLIKTGLSGVTMLAAGVLLLTRPGLGFPAVPTVADVTPAPQATTSGTNTTSDTSAGTTPEAADQSVVSRLAGVDVSHYQGEVDWSTLLAGGVSFAFAKASDGINYTDPMWQTNQQNAESAGVPLGGYHFYEPNDEPDLQAQNFLKALGDNSGRLPPVVDLEKSPASGQEAPYLQDVQTFLAAIEDATGCTPMIYASPYFYTKYLGDDVSRYPLWLAEYSATARPPNGRDWLFWQYSQNGTAAGISGAVDLDWFSGDSSALASLSC